MGRECFPWILRLRSIYFSSLDQDSRWVWTFPHRLFSPVINALIPHCVITLITLVLLYWLTGCKKQNTLLTYTPLCDHPGITNYHTGWLDVKKKQVTYSPLCDFFPHSPLCDFCLPTLAVGGGSAGCVLASRLSEDSTKRVLLLEAGGDDRGLSIISVPMAGMDLRRSEYDWNYSTVPQKHSLQGLEGQVLCFYALSCLLVLVCVHQNWTSFETARAWEEALVICHVLQVMQQTLIC